MYKYILPSLRYFYMNAEPLDIFPSKWVSWNVIVFLFLITFFYLKFSTLIESFFSYTRISESDSDTDDLSGSSSEDDSSKRRVPLKSKNQILGRSQRFLSDLTI